MQHREHEGNVQVGSGTDQGDVPRCSWTEVPGEMPLMHLSIWRNLENWQSLWWIMKLQYLGHLMRRAESFEKTLMLGKIEGRRRRGREDEMVGWHHRLSGRGFGWALGVGDGQGGLACCNSWGRKEMLPSGLNWWWINMEKQTHAHTKHQEKQTKIVRRKRVIPLSGREQHPHSNNSVTTAHLLSKIQYNCWEAGAQKFRVGGKSIHNFKYERIKKIRGVLFRDMEANTLLPKNVGR